MIPPKTLEQMAEEYSRLEYERWLDSPALDGGTAMHNQIARFYMEGAKAALSLPEVRDLRQAIENYCRANRVAENQPSGSCYDQFNKALAAFDRLSAEVGE